METLGLVLSGGGSKGAYQIGVYKALRKMNIKIDIVTGTSIGAINGMFVVQKNLRKVLRFWKKISFEKIYKKEDFPKLTDEKLSKVYAQYLKTFINEGGMDVSKIKKMFDKYYKPNKFFNSEIDYGLVTYNFTKKKPVIKTKKDLNSLNTKDYVLASASCYPAFKPYTINNEIFIDGGYYDNIPINLAIKMGATQIIAVDLRTVGLKKKVIDESVEVIYIAPRNKIASFLVFDGKRAKEAIKFGYNDAMKTFGKLDGNKFTFKKNNLVKNYNKYNDLYEDNLRKIFINKKSKLASKIFENPLFNEILNRKTLYSDFNKIIEKAGKIFNLREEKCYNIKRYNKKISKELKKINQISVEEIISNVKDKNIKGILDSKKIVKFFYNSIITDSKSMIKYIPIFQKEFLVALYIYTINY